MHSSNSAAGLLRGTDCVDELDEVDDEAEDEGGADGFGLGGSAAGSTLTSLSVRPARQRLAAALHVFSKGAHETPAVSRASGVILSSVDQAIRLTETCASSLATSVV